MSSFKINSTRESRSPRSSCSGGRRRRRRKNEKRKESNEEDKKVDVVGDEDKAGKKEDGEDEGETDPKMSFSYFCLLLGIDNTLFLLFTKMH